MEKNIPLNMMQDLFAVKFYNIKVKHRPVLIFTFNIKKVVYTIL